MLISFIIIQLIVWFVHFAQVYYVQNGKNSSVILYAHNPRPISQSYEHLTVVFTAESDTSLHKRHLGFHAHYEFVKGELYVQLDK